MIINEKLKKELFNLEDNINLLTTNDRLTDTQLENFLKGFEKIRYNLLSEIKLYNQTKEFEYERIKTLDDDYQAEYRNNMLKIYIPEVMPSYKNLKTHTHKRILLNVADKTKMFANMFDGEVIIYIKVFDKIQTWDIDNKFIKPISDGLIMSGVIKDDNISKMFYCAKGEFSENPHTEVYIFEGKNVSDFLENIVS